MQLLAVTHDHDHGRLALHLFLVVEILGVGAFWWRNLFSARRTVRAVIIAFATFHGGWSVIMVVLGAAQRRPYQAAIRKRILFSRTLHRHRLDGILHDDTAFSGLPQHRAAGFVGNQG